VAVTGELAELLAQLERRGIGALSEVLGRPLSHGPTDVSAVEAIQRPQTFRELIEVIGDGVTLTSAGYLPAVVVESFAERSGTPIEDWADEIGDLLYGLGWRTDQERYTPPPAHSPTLAVLTNSLAQHATASG
jgi:hypothetical protein